MALQFRFKGRRAVFFAHPVPDKDGLFHPELVIEDDPVTCPTRYDGGTSLRACEALVAEMNAENGYSSEDVARIIGSSIKRSDEAKPLTARAS